MSPSVHSIDQVVLIGLVVSVIAAVLTWRSRSGLSKMIFGLVTICVLTPSVILFVGRNPWLVESRYRTFKLLYWNLRIGMNHEEVQANVKKLYPPNGEQKQPLIYQTGAGKMEIQMAPEASDESGHETIILKMQDDQVRGINYQARE